MGFYRQSPPSFRGGTSTRAPRNQQGNLPGSQAGAMASMAQQLRKAKSSNQRGQNFDMMTNKGMLPGGGQPRPMQTMPTTRAGQIAQSAGRAPGGLGAIAGQVQAGQNPMQAQPVQQQGQLAQPQQAYLSRLSGQAPAQPQAPTGQPTMSDMRYRGPAPGGGKGGRAPQPPGASIQGGNQWGNILGAMYGGGSQQGRQMGGKGGRALTPQPYRGGKGGRSPNPPRYGGYQ